MRTVIFDIESTDIDITKARIIEIAFLDGENKEKSYLINPKTEISKEVEELTGITNEMVKDKPVFADVASEIYDIVNDANLIGHNIIRYDIPLLMQEFSRNDIDWFPDLKKVKIIDTMRLFEAAIPRTLEFAYKFFCNKEPENAHRAADDVRMTKEIVKAQKENHSDLIGKTMDELCKTSFRNEVVVDISGKLGVNDEGDVIWRFGKNKGRCVAEDPDYVSWVLSSDFPIDTKICLERAIAKNGSL